MALTISFGKIIIKKQTESSEQFYQRASEIKLTNISTCIEFIINATEHLSWWKQHHPSVFVDHDENSDLTYAARIIAK
jgi:hypothetical protein